DMRRAENVARGHAVRRHQRHARNVADRAGEVLVDRDVDEHRLADDVPSLENRRRRFGFCLRRGKTVDDDDVAALQLLGQRRAQRAALHLLRQPVVVAARHRPEDGPALAPQRIPDLAHAGAARALLAPRLLAAAADVRAVLRLVRAAPLRRVRVHDRLPHQIAVDAPAEDIVVDLDAADLPVLVVHDIELHWCLSHFADYFFPFFGFSTCATLIFFAVSALRTIT